MDRDWGTCRFCGQTSNYDRMVKYGVRHYAHFDCYLDHKPLSELHAWQVGTFPWKVLRDRGLEAEAAELIKR